jgi:hypothetical protein
MLRRNRKIKILWLIKIKERESAATPILIKPQTVTYTLKKIKENQPMD